ncbi:site-specific tyrosine recombinase XerD [Cohnella sp. JJ-181]|uniref:site-specific tyrosine recombinase XerD n=1 Tax=Cohnella rhizoplanae TaxID=2974897 RepID=UPI0022FFBDBB|nr:site-specific tyrosine recombinase XerD [Cohnella sp. JJ-181]CAI6056893.1 Tyrosine recombinase XerD [Cohnella sp. JJ-181]
MNQDIITFLSHLRATRHLAANSLDGYRRDLEDVSRDLQEHDDISRTADIKPHHLSSYIHRLKEQGRTNATVSRRIVSIKAFFQFALEAGMTGANPALRLSPPRAERRSPKALSLSDVERLLEAPDLSDEAGVRDRTMLETLYATGMRVTELTGLNVADVRTDLRLIVCRGTGGRERMIPISSMCRDWMLKYLQEARPGLLRPGSVENALFLSHLGSRMTRQGFWKLIKKHAAAAGVSTEVTPHTLRHSFAYHLVDNGADLRSVQEILGHSDLTATQVYQPSSKAKLRDVYDSFHPRAGAAHDDEDQ